MTREKSIITDCVNHAFLFPVIVKTSLWAWLYMQTNQSRSHTTTTSFVGLSQGSHTDPLSTCPNHQRARYQTTRGSPYAPGLLKLLKLAKPKPVHSASFISPLENHNKDSCSCSPLTPAAFWPTLCFPIWPHSAWCALFTTYLFHSSSLLVCWPHCAWITPTFENTNWVWWARKKESNTTSSCTTLHLPTRFQWPFRTLNTLSCFPPQHIHTCLSFCQEFSYPFSSGG